MKLQKLVAGLGLVAGSVVALSTAPAQAFNFNSGSALGTCSTVPLENLGNNGISKGPATCETADGFTLTAMPSPKAKLTVKEVNGFKGVGVFHDSSRAGQGSQQEIDNGETLSASLINPSLIKSIDIAFLYMKGNSRISMGDVVNEVAQITAGGFKGTLTVLNAFQAEWKWNNITQIVNAMSPANKSGGGLFSIANPFGGKKISLIEFSSPAEAGKSFQYSDYSLAGIEAEAVPEPTTVIGLALVGGGFVASRRRQARKA